MIARCTHAVDRPHLPVSSCITERGKGGAETRTTTKRGGGKPAGSTTYGLHWSKESADILLWIDWQQYQRYIETAASAIIIGSWPRSYESRGRVSRSTKPRRGRRRQWTAIMLFQATRRRRRKARERVAGGLTAATKRSCSSFFRSRGPICRIRQQQQLHSCGIAKRRTGKAGQQTT